MNEFPPIEPESAALPVPADPATIAKLRRKARLFQRAYRLNRALGLAVLFPLVFLMIYEESVWHHPGIQWYTVIGIALGPAIALMYLWTMQWKKAMNGLLRIEDIQNIGLFIEGCDVKHEQLFVMETLTRLLPRLKASDAGLLTPAHHRILNRVLCGQDFLGFTSNTPLILATLKAYEQVGGAEDLPTVERLANGGGYAKRNKDIREAAQACLPYLQARSEGQELRQNLLRASRETADNPGTLLRPAQAAGAADPALLLRASDAEPPQ